MRWRCRVVFTDRARGLADLTAAAAEQQVMLLGVRMFLGWRGQPADDIVLETPAGWLPGHAYEFLLAAGAASAKVLPPPRDDDLSREDLGEWAARLAHPSSGARLRDPELLVG